MPKTITETPEGLLKFRNLPAGKNTSHTYNYQCFRGELPGRESASCLGTKKHKVPVTELNEKGWLGETSWECSFP